MDLEEICLFPKLILRSLIVKGGNMKTLFFNKLKINKIYLESDKLINMLRISYIEQKVCSELTERDQIIF